MAVNSLERTTSQGRKFSLTSRTNTRSSSSRYPPIGEMWPAPVPKIGSRLKLMDIAAARVVDIAQDVPECLRRQIAQDVDLP